MEEKLTVSVRVLRRKGQEIPRHFHAMGHGIRGVLTIKEEFVQALHRHAKVARLLPDGEQVPNGSVAPLVDPQILDWTPYYWVLTGMERFDDNLTVTDYVQSWWVFPVAVTTVTE